MECLITKRFQRENQVSLLVPVSFDPFNNSVRRGKHGRPSFWGNNPQKGLGLKTTRGFVLVLSKSLFLLLPNNPCCFPREEWCWSRGPAVEMDWEWFLGGAPLSVAIWDAVFSRWRETIKNSYRTFHKFKSYISQELISRGGLQLISGKVIGECLQVISVADRIWALFAA